MKSLLVTFLAIFVSSSAYANDFDFNVSPKSPIVVKADLISPTGETFRAPWFKASYLILNSSDSPITIVGLRFTTTSPEGKLSVASLDLPTPTEVSAKGGTLNVQHIVDKLAESGSYEYGVEVIAIGWIGSINNPSEPLDLSAQFKTR